MCRLEHFSRLRRGSPGSSRRGAWWLHGCARREEKGLDKGRGVPPFYLLMQGLQDSFNASAAPLPESETPQMTELRRRVETLETLSLRGRSGDAEAGPKRRGRPRG